MSAEQPFSAPVSDPVDGQHLLDVRELSVRFASDDGPVQAVDDVSFRLGHGEIVALVGESGCGKSVTAMAVLGLLPSSADVTGSIEFAGRELTGLAKRTMSDIRGRDIAMVFQEPMTSLNPVLTVGRQIGEVLRRHEGLSRKASRERARELLELVGIPAPERRVREYPHQLSGGMRQRVMIAMAVACDPKVLVADEPTTALDVTIQAGVLDVFRDLRDRLGTSIIVITHDLGVVADLADRVVVMYAGQRVEQADVDDLFEEPQHPYTLGLLGAVPNPDDADEHGPGRRLSEIPGKVPVLSQPADTCVFSPRCPRATQECVSQVPPLDELRPRHWAACFHPGADPEAGGRRGGDARTIREDTA